MIARHCVVHGRVQGVGYRWAVRDGADLRGVEGWIRNMRDGGVEVFIQGGPDLVEEFLGFLEHGPRVARVDHIHVADAPPDPTIGGFEIRF